MNPTKAEPPVTQEEVDLHATMLDEFALHGDAALIRRLWVELQATRDELNRANAMSESIFARAKLRTTKGGKAPAEQMTPLEHVARGFSDAEARYRAKPQPNIEFADAIMDYVGPGYDTNSGGAEGMLCRAAALLRAGKCS